jgi:hypothetical protein
MNMFLKSDYNSRNSYYMINIGSPILLNKLGMFHRIVNKSMMKKDNIQWNKLTNKFLMLMWNKDQNYKNYRMNLRNLNMCNMKRRMVSKSR